MKVELAEDFKLNTYGKSFCESPNFAAIVSNLRYCHKSAGLVS